MTKPVSQSWRAYLTADVSVRARWLRYREYVHSAEWRRIRAKVLKRDQERCQLTGKTAKARDPLQVHHLRYQRVGAEKLDDLVTVCRSAHKAIHRKARR